MSMALQRLDPAAVRFARRRVWQRSAYRFLWALWFALFVNWVLVIISPAPGALQSTNFKIFTAAMPFSTLSMLWLRRKELKFRKWGF